MVTCSSHRLACVCILDSLVASEPRFISSQSFLPLLPNEELYNQKDIPHYFFMFPPPPLLLSPIGTFVSFFKSTQRALSFPCFVKWSIFTLAYTHIHTHTHTYTHSGEKDGEKNVRPTNEPSNQVTTKNSLNCSKWHSILLFFSRSFVDLIQIFGQPSWLRIY